jgi:hypothetical protein
LTEAFVPTKERIATPYTVQAATALARGWFSIPVKGKSHVPKGVTGSAGTVDKDTVRKHLISREAGYDNLGIRHDGTIAIDVDVYEEKNGVESLRKFATQHNLSPLPPTYSSTARGPQSPSRQYFYRLPEYVKLESKPRIDGHLAEDVEICQYHHRFSVIYPSVHPDTGEVYMWYLPGDEGFSWGEVTDEMPDVDDLPELPEEWIIALQRAEDSELDYDADVTDADSLISTFRDGEPSPPVLKAIETARTQHPGHDATYSSLYNAFMFGREGHPGVRRLVSIIVSRHQEYLETEHPDRALKNEVQAIIKDASTKAQQSPVESTYRPYNPLIALSQIASSSSPGSLGFTSLGTIATSVPSYGVPEETDTYWVLPTEVWGYSTELKMIRQAALARQVSPDVVLHACLATVASLLPHQSRLETGKGPSVLSYYAVAVGDSGGGKTEALSCADDLLSTWRSGRILNLGEKGYVRAELGSGEGMVEAFMGSKEMEVPIRADDGTPLKDDDDNPLTKKEKVRVQVRHNAMFSSDEGRQMLAIASRSGSTIMSTLCSMWSGTATGSSNAKAENSRTIAKGSYVLGLLLGFQPKTMDALFDDVAGGAPQRFAYAATAHPDITADEIDFPEGLSPQIPMMAPLQMTLSDKHRRIVREHMALRARGEVEVGALDGHRMLLLCRTAALLAILHSKQEVTDEIWELAEVIVNRSCEFRDHLSQRAAMEAQAEAARRAEAVINTTVTSQAMVVRSSKVTDLADILVDKLENAEGHLTKAEIQRKIAAARRNHFAEALELAIADGRIVEEEVPNPKSGPKRIKVLRLADISDD